MKIKLNHYCRLISLLICVLLIAFSLLLILNRQQKKTVSIYPENGILEIDRLDCTSNIYQIMNNWDFFPNELYTPQNIPSIAYDSDRSANDFKYGTYRLIIKAKPNTYYTLCGYSIDYSTRVFVNGDKILDIGKVSDNSIHSSPRIDYMNIPLYSDKNGQICIIYQYSNFIHNDGGCIQPTFISSPENIKKFNQGNDLSSIFFGSCLFIFFCVFLLNAVIESNTNYLCLAFCCLILSMRDQNFFTIHIIPQSVKWVYIYRLFILSVSLLPPAIMLLLKSMYKDVGNKKITISYLSIVIIHGILHFILDTHNLVFLCTSAYYIAIPYLCYLIYCVIKHYKNTKHFDISDFLIISSYVLLLLSLIIEGLLTSQYSSVSRNGITPYIMLLFVLMLSIAIDLLTKKRELAYQEEHKKAELLKQINKMNHDFLQNIAHELKTPLTVISGYAQLTQMQIDSCATDIETQKNLKTIQTESLRLGNLVSSLIKYSYKIQSDKILARVNIDTLLNHVLALCRPICNKNNNNLIIDTEGNLYAHGNQEMLTQILINLIINANKHTKDGKISVKVQQDKSVLNQIEFFVSDTGNGIAKENIPFIFNRGFSTDSSSGLGLSICKEAVEAQNGIITLEHSDSNQTVFRFTVSKEVANN